LTTFEIETQQNMAAFSSLCGNFAQCTVLPTVRVFVSHFCVVVVLVVVMVVE
jgi:hypothetical protein